MIKTTNGYLLTMTDSDHIDNITDYGLYLICNPELLQGDIKPHLYFFLNEIAQLLDMGDITDARYNLLFPDSL